MGSARTPQKLLRGNVAAHIRQSTPDSGLDFQVKIIKTFPSCSLFARQQKTNCADGTGLGKQTMRAAAEREGNNLKYSKDVCLKNGSSQGQNLALTVVFVPISLDSGGQASVM